MKISNSHARTLGLLSLSFLVFTSLFLPLFSFFLFHLFLFYGFTSSLPNLFETKRLCCCHHCCFGCGQNKHILLFIQTWYAGTSQCNLCCSEGAKQAIEAMNLLY
jgi:hypothetical protein